MTRQNKDTKLLSHNPSSSSSSSGLIFGANITEQSQIKQRRDALSTLLNNITSELTTDCRDPNHLLLLSRDIASEFASDQTTTEFSSYCKSVLRVAALALDRIEGLEQERAAKDSLEQRLVILKEEQARLEERKKALSAGQQSELDQLEKKVASLRLPFFLGTSQEHTDLIKTIVEHAFTTVFDQCRCFADAISGDQHLRAHDIERFKRASQHLIDTLLNDVVCRKQSRAVRDPSLFISLIQQLRTRDQPHTNTSVVQLYQHARGVLDDLCAERALIPAREKRAQALIEKRERLDRQRNDLSSQEIKELHSVLLEEKLLVLQPSYYQLSTNYDTLYFLLLVETTFSSVDEFEKNNSASSSAAATSSTSNAQSLYESSLKTLESGVKRIDSIPTCLKLLTALSGRKLHMHVVQVSPHVNKLIDEQNEQLKRLNEVEANLKELDQKRIIHQMEGEKEQAEQVGEEIADLEKERDQVKEHTKFTQDEIDAFVLQVCDLVVPSAKIEDLDDVLREESVRAFKVDTSTERWDTVRNLTSTDDWDTIKQDLVVYVLRSKDNARAKIELLLRDGMYEQCIGLVPKPSGESGEVELLHRLWTEIEKRDASLLQQLLPSVQRYLKRYFQAFDFTTLDPLMERVQRRYPALITILYSKACDMVLLNILPSQYSKFVSMLKQFKSRLEELQRGDDWNQFLQQFKKKHRGKKRLIQMVTLLGDSAFDLRAMTSTKPSRKRQRTLK
mmetsp:Transcript_11501/g.17239  ORF Transcript_11501/g.17239 Transcript_11501/m.17239 type:complete len:733 (+) Transcript_11501:26-2224(+)